MPFTIEITPVVLNGSLETCHGTFDCDVTLSITKNGVKNEFAAKAIGDIQNNNHNGYYAILRDLGIFSGEVFVTWNDGDSSNRFHILKFLRHVKPAI